MNISILNNTKTMRARRTRAKLRGTAVKPRLSVHRTNRFIYAQIIDDENGVTLAAISSKSLDKKLSKSDAAVAVGEGIGKKALELGIKKAIFDRGSFRYHGRVKAVAEAARKAGLQF